MLARIKPHLTYANVAASIALFGVLAGGGAYAASKIGPKNIKKNAVRAKHIKKKSVTTAKIRNGAVSAAKLARPEPFRIVGAPGEPPFSNGGQNDCLWQNPPPSSGDLLANVNRASFFKDADGIVHLAGTPMAVDGPGGDMTCDGGEVSDVAIFRLPAGYRPGRLEVFASGNTSIGINFIVPESGVTLGGNFVPGGSVLVSGVDAGDATTLDGFTFRAAGSATTSSSSRKPPSASLEELRSLLD